MIANGGTGLNRRLECCAVHWYFSLGNSQSNPGWHGIVEICGEAEDFHNVTSYH